MFVGKHVDLLLIGEREKSTMFLLQILICLCMIMHCGKKHFCC